MFFVDTELVVGLVEFGEFLLEFEFVFGGEFLLLVVEEFEVLGFGLGLLQLLEAELEFGLEVGVLGDELVILLFEGDVLVGPVG